MLQKRDTPEMMNNEILAGNWKQFKGNIQQKWIKLTEDDLDTADGGRVELVGKLQERYGYAKDEAERQMKAFEDHNQTALRAF
jgi:uncharacterized protein YjbJ (UPF0337 family)